MSIILDPHCALCQGPGGDILWQDGLCRVVRVGGAEGNDYPGYCRIIWRDHVREMTDLDTSERHRLMTLVFATESALRRLYAPDKINLASLGNLVPHLHWHVIPRFLDDPHFPSPIWSGERPRGNRAAAGPVVDNPALHQAISRAMSEASGENV
jgi:diadenosine tetraphosphate (Ap4A) HIT family hydrolase